MSTYLLPSGHRVRVEGCILLVHFVGDVTMDDWKKFRLISEEVIATEGRFYMIGHLPESGTIVPEVRRDYLNWLKEKPLLGVANIGGGRMSRALAVLLSNAIRLFLGVRIPTAFVQTEAEARAWVAELEAKHRRFHSNSQLPKQSE